MIHQQRMVALGFMNVEDVIKNNKYAHTVNVRVTNTGIASCFLWECNIWMLGFSVFKKTTATTAFLVTEQAVKRFKMR